MNALLGLAVFVVGVYGVVHFRARNGEPHALLLRPGMSMAIPMVLLVLMTLGAATFVAGLLK